MELDHRDLGNPFKGFRFKFLEPSEYATTLKFLEKYLYPSLIPLGYSEEHPEDWHNLFRVMMENDSNLSYLAVHEKSGETAACRMIDLIVKGKYFKIPRVTYKGNLSILNLMDGINKEEDLFGKYGITRYPEMYGMCVKPKYRQMGLASEMYRRDLQFLKRRGFDIVRCAFISSYARQAGVKQGYQEFGRRGFHECKDEKGNILNPNSDPNEFISWGVFNLRSEVKPIIVH